MSDLAAKTLAYESSECPACVLTQLYTWGIFMVLYLMAWDASLTTIINRFESDLLAALDDGRTLRRPYMIVLAGYSVAVAWINIVFFCLLVYIVCALACMTAPAAGIVWWERLMYILARPIIVLHCIDLSHVVFHGTAMACMLISMAVSIGFYITDEDMMDRYAVRSKMLRVLFTGPAALAAAYAIYIAFCVVCTF